MRGGGLLLGLGALVALLALGGTASASGSGWGPAVASRSIEDLHPTIRWRAEELLDLAAERGIYLRVVSTYRSLAEQQRLYNQGRTAPGPIVTNARPGQSWHNYGLAFDVAVDGDGDPETNDPEWPNDEKLWAEVADLGRSIGLRAGADFGDLTHFEYHPGLSLAQAAAGERPTA